MRASILLFSLCFAFGSVAQDITGRWITVNDETGAQRSVVEITVKNGVASAHVKELFRTPDQEQDPVCTKCTDHRKGQKIIGMQIMRNMKQDEDEWSGGTIMDPENGRSYDCKIWVEDGELKVRGYIAFFYRTQAWVREKG